METRHRRRLPVGAEVVARAGGTHFRLWAPKRKRVDVVVGDAVFPLSREQDGYFSGVVESVTEGARYRFRLDGERSFPDPASRYQPEGPHGPSQVVDPARFRWTDAAWRGVERGRQVLYEMHLGTHTRDGTYAAAAERLADLADLGITTIEVMPIGEFAGRFGWGYDGVDLFAPYHHYGSPDDFRGFVNRAHELGLGVVLDVVYNHFGPDGNYLREFADHYFTDRHTTDWGEAINYDGTDSGPVREFVLANVRHWIAEYHLDGLRLDATDNIYDDSSPHLIAEIASAAREAAGARQVIVLAENEAQHARLVRAQDRDGFGLDMVWSDDFHHTAFVSATGRREAYFTDYRGTPQEFVSAAKYGYLYQGQRYEWQDKLRGSAAWDVPAGQFVHYLENHDQVANSRFGQRLHQTTSPSRYRALTALLLLGPQTPLLFQGQEFGSSAPFLFFADHHDGLRPLVRTGRGRFLAQFPSWADAATQASLPDPGAAETFTRCVLDETERADRREFRALHRDLIALRQCDPVLSTGEFRLDGAVLAPDAFVLRYFASAEGLDRLLVVNLGVDRALDIVPEPLLAAPSGTVWAQLWHSEDPCYGGRGAPPIISENGSWRLPAESATLLALDAR